MTSIKVERLLEKNEYGLELQLVTGAAGLSRVISSSRIQKPGLALTGFTEHLHEQRVQVFGNTEVSYLRTLPEGRQREVLMHLFQADLACVVVTKDLAVPPVLEVRGHVKAGKLRALAATSDKRVSALRTKIIRERGITTQ